MIDFVQSNYFKNRKTPKTRVPRPACAFFLLPVFLTLILCALPIEKLSAAENTSVEIPSAKLQQLFLEAGQAYDAGRPQEAVTLYNKLFEQGYISKELFFNLGNAFFKSGQMGKAILNYRRAWYLAPRDPDISANFRFALQTTMALTPTTSAVDRLLSHFSLSGWIIIVLFGYWIAALITGLLLLFRNWRRILIRSLVVAGILLAIGIGGIWNWASLYRNPELVVLAKSQQALFAPLDGSTPHFSLPEGSIVRAEEESGPWIKVILGKQSGWIKKSVCEAVYPWKT